MTSGALRLSDAQLFILRRIQRGGVLLRRRTGKGEVTAFSSSLRVFEKEQDIEALVLGEGPGRPLIVFPPFAEGVSVVTAEITDLGLMYAARHDKRGS